MAATFTTLAYLVAAVLFGAFYNTTLTAGVIWSTRVFADHPAAGLAAFSCALTVGTLAGPALAGLVIDTAGHPIMLIGSAVLVAAALPFCPPTARRRAVLAEHICRAAPAGP